MTPLFRSTILLSALWLAACGSRESSSAGGTAAAIPGASATGTPDQEASRAVRDSIARRGAARFQARPDSNLGRADTARSVGDAGAKVWVILVSHLQDGATAEVIRTLIPAIKTQYVAPGKVRFAFVNAPAADTIWNARFAAHASYCAALSGKFWPVWEQIALTWDEWERNPDPQPRFDSLAVRAGADPKIQSLCTQRKLMMPLIVWDQERAQKAGVTQIPTLLIGNQKLSGDLSMKRVSAAIDAELAKK